MNTQLAEVGETFLKHFGVAGMKWGVRNKSRRSQGKGSSEKTRFKTAPHKLTEEQLQRRIKRLETEKRYNELNSRTVSHGERLAKEILTNSGRTVATTVVTGVALFGVKQALTKKFGADTANAMLPKKKK